MKLVIILVIAILSTALLGCSSCPPQPIHLKVLAFAMKWPALPQSQWVPIRQELETGHRTLADALFHGPTCDFVNDAAAANQPTVRLHGTPGDLNLNFS